MWDDVSAIDETALLAKVKVSCLRIERTQQTKMEEKEKIDKEVRAVSIPNTHTKKENDRNVWTDRAKAWGGRGGGGETCTN